MVGAPPTLICAREASCRLPATVGGCVREGQEIVLDTMVEFDGLEFLFVIAVALDTPISSRSGQVLATRSHLYRAITRGQMMVTVVNEVVRGGWLEFLGHIELDGAEATGGFDMEAARSSTDRNAAKAIMQRSAQQEAEEGKGIGKADRKQAAEKDEEKETVEEKGKGEGEEVGEEGDKAKQTQGEEEKEGEGEQKPVKKIVQSIWDTSSNDAGVERLAQAGDGKEATPQFMPFKVRRARCLRVAADVAARPWLRWSCGGICAHLHLPAWVGRGGRRGEAGVVCVAAFW